jgi:hypothetical protein
MPTKKRGRTRRDKEQHKKRKRTRQDKEQHKKRLVKAGKDEKIPMQD